MSKLISFLLTSLFIAMLVLVISGCPGKLSPTPPKTSTITTSEIAEAVASGAVNSTYVSGSMARYRPRSPRAVALSKIIESYLNPLPRAEAAIAGGLCPTLQSGEYGVVVPNASCTVVPNITGALNIETLTWAPCNMALPLGTWSGGTNFSLVTSPLGTPMACTGFPTFQNGDVLIRSFFSPTARINNANLDPVDNVPWNPLTQLDLQPPNGSGPVTVLVDTFGATQIPNNIDPNNGSANTFPSLPVNYPPSGNSGYLYSVPTLGERIQYSGAVARSITVNGLHLKADVAGYIVWDFTVSTFNAAGVGAALAVDGTNRLTGTLFIQDNINLITTQSVFGGPVTYTAGCGVPNGGTVVTTAAPGSVFPPGTETLSFPGPCGTGSISGNQFYLFHAF